MGETMNRKARRAAGYKRAAALLPDVKPGKNPPWTPFVPGTSPEITPERIRASMAHTGATYEEVEASMRDIVEGDTIVLNSRYQVNIRKRPGHGFLGAEMLLHLSIKRRDKAPAGPERFRDFQRIKNELAGPECEAVEVYPAEDRLVDTSNQYHLWVLPPGVRLPFGFEGRLVLRESGAGAVQQPFEGDDT